MPYIDKAKIEQIESAGRTRAVSPKGAVGLRQITKPALTDYNKAHPAEAFTMNDMFEPQKNRQVSDWYIDKRIPNMLKSYEISDTTENRLAAYNAGVGALSRALKKKVPLPKETRDYIKKYSSK